VSGARGPYLTLVAGVLCVSFGSILVRLASAPPLAVSFHRVFLASLILAPFACLPLLRALRRLPVRQRVLLVGAGLALAVHFATWIASLSYTSVASSVLLVNTTPLFTLGLSRILLGESVPAVVSRAIVLAMGGAGLIAAGDWAAGSDSLFGDALALVGAVTLSAYHIVGRGLRDALPLGAYVLGVWATAAAILALIATLARVTLTAYPVRTFGVFLALALVPTLGGHGLVNRALRALPAPTVSVFLLGEPVGATLLALAIFGEAPTPWTLAGGAVVLLALVLVARTGAS
jgi:drug/metabolite transporter (DMT)-like permease